jgi:hypothetical protein
MTEQDSIGGDERVSQLIRAARWAALGGAWAEASRSSP